MTISTQLTMAVELHDEAFSNLILSTVITQNMLPSILVQISNNCILTISIKVIVKVVTVMLIPIGNRSTQQSILINVECLVQV